MSLSVCLFYCVLIGVSCHGAEVVGTDHEACVEDDEVGGKYVRPFFPSCAQQWKAFTQAMGATNYSVTLLLYFL